MQGRENSGIKDATSLQDMGKVGCMEEPLENNLGDTNFSHSATRNKKITNSPNLFERGKTQMFIWYYV